MKYYVTMYGQEFEVDLTQTPQDELMASLDGRSYRVDVDEIRARRRFSVLLDSISWDVVSEPGAHGLHLQVGGYRVDAGVEDERERSARKIAAQMPQGPTTISAMMPGIVRGVLVEPGQSVSEGQPVVILEAMKMENELAAEQAGVVREVLVESGVAVDGGTPLVVLDPPPDEEGAA